MVGLVRNSEPPAFRRWGSTGGTGPEAAPKRTSIPLTRKAASEPSNVSFPTPSYTTSAPVPLVISLTRAAKPSYRSTWSAPASRASCSFASVDTVVMTSAPRALSSWISSRPTPPAPACSRTVCPGSTLKVEFIR